MKVHLAEVVPAILLKQDPGYIGRNLEWAIPAMRGPNERKPSG